MFENLSERLERSFKILKGEGKITEVNISEAMKDIRRALLDADVSYKIAKQFCDDVKKKAIGQNVLTAVKPQQMIVKIVHDELAALMGSQSSDINIKGAPAVVLVAGLNGSGKSSWLNCISFNAIQRGFKVAMFSGELMQLTVAQYFTPNGNEVHKIGITPDVVVEMPEEQKSMFFEIGDLTDVQLNEAYRVALDMLKDAQVE